MMSRVDLNRASAVTALGRTVLILSLALLAPAAGPLAAGQEDGRTCTPLYDVRVAPSGEEMQQVYREGDRILLELEAGKHLALNDQSLEEGYWYEFCRFDAAANAYILRINSGLEWSEEILVDRRAGDLAEIEGWPHFTQSGARLAVAQWAYDTVWGGVSIWRKLERDGWGREHLFEVGENNPSLGPSDRVPRFGRWIGEDILIVESVQPWEAHPPVAIPVYMMKTEQGWHSYGREPR